MDFVWLRAFVFFVLSWGLLQRSVAQDRSGAQLRALAVCAEQLGEYSKNRIESSTSNPVPAQRANMSFAGRRGGQIGLWQIFGQGEQRRACFHPARACQTQVLESTEVKGLDALEEQQRKACEVSNMNTIEAFFALVWPARGVQPPTPPTISRDCMSPTFMDCENRLPIVAGYKPVENSSIARLSLAYGSTPELVYDPDTKTRQPAPPTGTEVVGPDAVQATEIWVRQLIMNSLAPEFYRQHLGTSDPNHAFRRLHEQIQKCKAELDKLQDGELTNLRNRVNLNHFWLENLRNRRQMNSTAASNNPDPRTGDQSCSRPGEISQRRPAQPQPVNRSPRPSGARR